MCALHTGVIKSMFIKCGCSVREVECCISVLSCWLNFHCRVVCRVCRAEGNSSLGFVILRYYFVSPKLVTMETSMINCCTEHCWTSDSVVILIAVANHVLSMPL